MSVLRRNNVIVSGEGPRTMVFSHGFGCDLSAWSDVEPTFRSDFRTVLFDHVGAGGSDLSAYRPERHRSLHGYADDVLEILEEAELRDVVFVGHSVAAMISVLAAIKAPDRFGALVMICASPRYLDEPGYVGGFSRQDVDELLEMIDSNFLGWSRAATPSIMGNTERPELGLALGNSFCRTDPTIARLFARATFLSDHRPDLQNCRTRALVLQTRADMIAPMEVGRFVADRMPDAELAIMQATGHCPHMSAAEETISMIRRFLGL